MTYKSFITTFIAFVLASFACAESPLESQPSAFVRIGALETAPAIDKENVQALWVWRFKPPFGSWQVARQRGTSEQGQESDRDDTVFSTFAWVF